MTNHLVRLTAGLALALCSQFALAGLLGTTVTQCADTAYSGVVTADVTACNPGTVQPGPASALVGAGVEFNIAGNRFFDFGDDTLTISYVQPVSSASPDLIIFTMEQAVTGITLVSANPLGLSWTFSGNQVGVLIGSPLANGNVILRFGSQAVPVPEPGSLTLAALAFLAMMAMASARRRS
jgi:hypothetical protein